MRLPALVAVLASTAVVPLTAKAAASLQITPATWNVIGLDSNSPGTGPNRFPVGARVCNSGDQAATTVTATFKWDATDPNIALRPGTSSSLAIGTMAAGACADAYFEVEVVRNATSYGRSARYYIELTSSLPTITTPRPRALYVERLVSQARNAILDLQVGESLAAMSSVPDGGGINLLVGKSYYLRVVGETATQGYEQIESVLTLPNTIFQTLSVQTTYSADTSPYVANPSVLPYGDGCLWDNDPNSPSYRACRSSGKAGGATVTTYHVKVLAASAGPEKLSALLYDFSGSSFHYNGDYDVASRTAYVVNPGDLGFAAAFTPSSTTAGGTSTLAYRITNPGIAPTTGVSFTVPLPPSPAAMLVAAAPNASIVGCGAATFTPSAGANTLSFSGGTIAAGATCTIKVNVTAPSIGTYNVTSTALFIDGATDTGKTSSASLAVAAAGGACTTGTMARWTVPTGTTANPPDTLGGSPTLRAGNVTIAALSALLPSSTQIVTNAGQGDTTAWSTYGYKNAGQYIQMVVDTSKYTDVQFRFYVANLGASNGPTSVVVAYNSGSGFNNVLTIPSPAAAFTQHIVDLTGLTSTTGTTTIRISATGANNDASGAALTYDNLTFSGCSNTPPPTLSKSFGSSSMRREVDTSRLTFNVGNSTVGAVPLTGVAFTDTMPTGLVVATPSGVSTTCSSASVTAVPGTNIIALSGATLAANASCTVGVDVKGTRAGIYDNVSGNISANETPTNTGASGYGAASITVIAPPSIAASFADTPIFTSASTTARVTLANPNVATTLTDVAFTATLPAGLEVADDVDSVCGGTLITTAPSTIVFGGGSLAALASCDIGILVTGAAADVMDTTFGPVSATNGGTGNSAFASMVVEDPVTAIALLKQVAPSATGPWSSFQAVAAGADVYYRFVLENVGDVALNSIAVADPNIAMTCPAWPNLPVASAANDDHIASCVLGPFPAAMGSHVNTATGQGTFGVATATSQSSATYATTGLSLGVSAQETSYAIAGDVLHFEYLISNTGFADLIGPATVDEVLASATCPSLTTIGDFDAILDAGESVTCTAAYTVSGGDVTTGFVTSGATASVNGVTSSLESATVSAEVLCAQPTAPANGTYASCNGASSGGTCVLTCDPGYTASGNATCTAGTWSTETCTANPCPTPPSGPANGAYGACLNTPSGGSCTLTCDPGYTASGNATCTLGAWSSETCTPSACGQPSAPTNGVYGACNGTASGGSCTLTCDAGYTASGNATCSFGVWSIETCAPNACAQPTAPANGAYGACNGTASGGSCALTCDPGYTASGNSTCALGVWSSETCTPNGCAQPSAPANGTYAACNATASGGSCVLTCDPGYTASGNATCSLGAWSTETCSPNACAQPSAPANGTYAACNNTSSGGSCALTCDAGYTASGNATCSLGAWSSPTCDANPCAQPAAPANGSYSACANTPSGGSCALACATGYTASGSATCTLGTWSTESCDPDGCTQPSAPANGTYAACASTPSGGTCALTCAAGYNASSDATCTLGTWSTPTCDLACTNDSHCGGTTPICDVRRAACVECLVNEQCASGLCNTDLNICTSGCANDGDCGGTTPRCNLADNLCVACLASSDCSAGVCDVSVNVCVGCMTSNDCAPTNVCDDGSKTCVPESCTTVDTCAGATPICDTVRDHCVACLIDSDCAPATVCDIASGSCIECRDDADCGGANPFCDLTSNSCVACVADDDCDDGVCHPTADSCVGCAGNSDCGRHRCEPTTFTCERVPYCGDAILDPGEGCDDGNLAYGDGCDMDCLIELGGACGASVPALVGAASCASGRCYLGVGAPGICAGRDSDFDGVPDIVDIDDDNDGLLDSSEGDGLVDTDGDRVPDSHDLDSDADGLNDAIEAGNAIGDDDIDGHVDCPSGVGVNGLCDDVETAPDSGTPESQPRDTDGDTIPDFRDVDSDGDGFSDATEAGHILVKPDGSVDCRSGSDDNGLCDDLETYPDSGSTDFNRDGIKDGTPRDTDGDGIPDFRDLDSDGDGLSDADEMLYGTNALNADSDGGGMNDAEEVAAGRDPNAAIDDVMFLSGGGGCQSTRGQAPLGLALMLTVLLLRRRASLRR